MTKVKSKLKLEITEPGTV